MATAENDNESDTPTRQNSPDSSRTRTRSLSAAKMKSQPFQRNAATASSTWRESILYDAVAGRVTSDRFVNANALPPSSRDVVTSSKLSVPPEEVLFRRKNAPTRYAENDIYFAASSALDGSLHEGDSSHGGLPSSDLLKAIHSYTADYYDRDRTGGGKALADWKSMDETALLAMGILLEEAAKASLGDAGDLVFVEGEEDADAMRRLQEEEEEKEEKKRRAEEEHATEEAVAHGSGKGNKKRKRTQETKKKEKRRKRSAPSESTRDPFSGADSD
ncbi:hypothetical protein L228DRAFT_245802 [Xylona heveae TC161]|uniref:Uncharacterized protein n=1 Tax=Xylona heveae (strain CBS 132557 / TC161) TaxID=1328760 RepID=A0A161TFH6_XYLHT|nr:hypothetical protein L228DRAFT_245802 [Xylona heveae TC161]KZF24787.1 hypothetical protein L228DRAFT_245802 [Xylona heveae TC161]